MIPNKLQSGQQFKASTVNKINEIIDYLKTQRISGDNKNIIVNHNTAGITIRSVDNTVSKGSNKASFSYPMKLYLDKQEGATESTLNVVQGRIQIYDQTQSRSYVTKNDNWAVPLTNIQEDGGYYAMLMVQHDERHENQNPHFSSSIFFITSGLTTANAPQTRGMFTIPIGLITKETVSGNANFSIKDQYILGNFNISNLALQHQFSVIATTTAYTDGTLKNTYSFSDFSFKVASGQVTFDDKLFNVPEQTFSISQASKIYCEVNQNLKTARLTVSAAIIQPKFLDKEHSIYTFEIADISINTEDTGLKIDQKINNQISMIGDTFKLKMKQVDEVPDYFSNKVVLQDIRNSELSSYTNDRNTYIGATIPSSMNSDNEVSCSFKPFFAWRSIQGYEKSGYQFISNSGDKLKFEPVSGIITISGSLANFEQIVSTSAASFLRWKDQYGTHGTGTFYYLYQNDIDGKLDKFTYGKNQSRCTGIQEWNFSTGQPSVTTPPVMTTDIQQYVLAGNSTTGPIWLPYLSGGSISGGVVSVSGSLRDLVEAKLSGTATILSWKNQFATNKTDQFKFLYQKPVSNELGLFTFGKNSYGKQAICQWDCASATPSIAYPPASSTIVENWIYAGNQSNGLSWIPYISGSPVNIEVSGCLTGFVQIISGTNLTLRWKEQFNKTIEDDVLYFMIENGQNGQLQAHTWGKSDQKKQGFMVWDYISGWAVCADPPLSTDSLSYYTYVGNKDTGLEWKPYHPEPYRVMIDDSSVLSLDTFPNYLVYKVLGDYGTMYADQNDSNYPSYTGIYQIANPFATSEHPNELALYVKWEYKQIEDWNESQYQQLNNKNGDLTWENAYRVRIKEADNSPDFLVNKIVADSPTPHIQIRDDSNKLKVKALPPQITGDDYITVETDSTGWEFELTFDDSQFIKSISEGECIEVEQTGASATISVDKDCIFEDFSITGDEYISVQGSGDTWALTFDDSEFIKTLSEGTCIEVERSGSTATISVDKDCIFEDFSITGDEYISVQGSGDTWALSLDDSNLIKDVVAGTCITVNKSSGVATVNINKSCVFSDFSITGNSPISVNGSGNSWSISMNGNFIRSISEGSCIQVSMSNNVATISVDTDCVFDQFTITGDEFISVEGSGDTWTLSFDETTLGKVKTTSTDSLGYLEDKLAGGSVVLYTTNGMYIHAALKTGTFSSPKQTIAVTQTGGPGIHNEIGAIQLQVNWDKLVIDSSLAPLITKQVSNGVCTLKLNTPQGKCVLMSKNGTLSWVSVSEC